MVMDASRRGKSPTRAIEADARFGRTHESARFTLTLGDLRW
jgi:hypothetical protein